GSNFPGPSSLAPVLGCSAANHLALPSDVRTLSSSAKATLQPKTLNYRTPGRCIKRQNGIRAVATWAAIAPIPPGLTPSPIMPPGGLQPPNALLISLLPNSAQHVNNFVTS